MMRYLHTFFFLGCCVCTSLQLWSQRTISGPSTMSYVFRSINQDNGLNSNFVFALGQDEAGFMWMGSTKGLQRYDGLRFLNCLHSGNHEGDINVTAIYADGPKHILYSQGDFALYQWDFLSHKNAAVPLSNQFDVYTDSAGNKWKLQRYRNDLYRIQKNGKGHIQVASFFNDGKDSWIVAEDFGLLLLDSIHHRLYSTEDNPLHHPLLDGIKKTQGVIRNMMVDHEGNIWLNSWTHPFYRYNIATRTLHTYSVADILRTQGTEGSVPGWVSSVMEDNHGVVWLATAFAGLLKYDPLQDKFQYITATPGNNLSLQYNQQINTLFQDRDENIWLGTDKGISIFSPYDNHFTIVSNKNEGSLLKSGTEITTAIETRNKEIWVGSWGGGIRIYDSTLQPTRYLLFKNKYDENLVWSLLEQAGGSIWAGCQAGILHLIDPVTLQVQTTKPKELRGSTIKCMIHEPGGNTLLGLQSGRIIVWDAAAQQFLPFVENELPLSPVENLYVNNGICWATTRAGLRAFDIHKRSFIATYKPEAEYAVYLNGIDALNDSTLIIGSANAGLFFFNKRSSVFTKVQIENEPAFAAARAVRKDSKGDIWYTGDDNIGFYKPHQQQFATYQPARGVMQDAFSSNVFLITQKGDWFTWSHTELVKFNPDKLGSFQPKGGIAITGFKVYADALPIDSLLQNNQPLKLSYQQNFISIEFSDLRYSNTSQTNYYYRLDGVDNNWVASGSRGYANYTNLVPGKYKFHVKSSNGGNESPEVSMQIYIKAPFWNTMWFRILCAAILAITLTAFILWYNGTVKKEANMKEQLAQTEMMALRAQMNPHFIFNCINSIDALIQGDDKYLATISLNKFAKLIRNILDSSQGPTTTLLQDLETLRLYIDLEQLRFEHPFTAEIYVDEALLHENCKVPPLIIQPYVENAIVHGLRNLDGGGKLQISIEKEDEHLRFTIEDNGIGRKATENRFHTHQPYGIEMSRNRVELFNGDEKIPVIITDLEENGRPTGTRVVVVLKYC
ncbi:MAG: histidine kinase [Chitinophagaceae bacterium]